MSEIRTCIQTLREAAIKHQEDKKLAEVLAGALEEIERRLRRLEQEAVAEVHAVDLSDPASANRDPRLPPTPRPGQ